VKMRRPSLLRYALLVAALLAPAAGVADVYTYTDENGVVHVTNRPPKNKDAKVVVKAPEQKAPPVSKDGLGAGVASASAQSGLPSGAAPYDPILREAAESFGLPLALLRAVCHSESGFNPNAVSPVGAEGLMQLMPATSARMGVIDPFDPRDNIMGGARFLKILSDHYGGDLVLMISAYHAGEGAVARAGGIPPYASTREYLVMVLSRYYRYKNVP
jgi:soluble lytic murein transglycosylase-like protein